MSVGWVKKWIKRLREALPEDEAVLHSQSRARKHPPARISQVVVDRLIEMRDQPPEGLTRTPGPKALLYYLPRDADLVGSGERLPRSSRTIYRILQQAGCICGRLPHHQEPCERPAPMRQWQVDFKDASTVPREAEGKQQHVVEVLNTIDMGTSILVAAQVGADFTAQTTLQAVAELLRTQGRPQVLTFDRDTRFVSSPQGSDFPSALVRFCYCLGVAVRLCDPHQPQQNDWVAYCTPSAWLACSLIFVSVLLRSMFIGWRENRDPMIIGSIHGKQTRSPPTHDGLLAHSVGFCSFLRRQQTAFA
jgi:hypothetical protein